MSSRETFAVLSTILHHYEYWPISVPGKWLNLCSEFCMKIERFCFVFFFWASDFWVVYGTALSGEGKPKPWWKMCLNSIPSYRVVILFSVPWECASWYLWEASSAIWACTVWNSTRPSRDQGWIGSSAILMLVYPPHTNLPPLPSPFPLSLPPPPPAASPFPSPFPPSLLPLFPLPFPLLLCSSSAPPPLLLPPSSPSCLPSLPFPLLPLSLPLPPPASSPLSLALPSCLFPSLSLPLPFPLLSPSAYVHITPSLHLQLWTKFLEQFTKPSLATPMQYKSNQGNNKYCIDAGWGSNFNQTQTKILTMTTAWTSDQIVSISRTASTSLPLQLYQEDAHLLGMCTLGRTCRLVSCWRLMMLSCWWVGYLHMDIHLDVSVLTTGWPISRHPLVNI